MLGLTQKFAFSTLRFSKTCLPALNEATGCLNVRTCSSKPRRENLPYTEYRHVYPEFLPDPDVRYRNTLREKLERSDMLKRRSQINIPEFYVGTIMAVTSSDKHSPSSPHRFVGICIKREGCGLKATFILRNVIDQQGVEILYEIYDPTIIKIEVLKLEKRLDDELLYLRDALPEYSTINPNREMELHPEGTPIPVNTTKVILKPRPWLKRWERENLKGVQDLDIPDFMKERAIQRATPWLKYDLMKNYMKTIPEEDQSEIFAEIQDQLQQLESNRYKLKRKRTFVKPIKTG